MYFQKFYGAQLSTSLLFITDRASSRYQCWSAIRQYMTACKWSAQFSEQTTWCMQLVSLACYSHHVAPKWFHHATNDDYLSYLKTLFLLSKMTIRKSNKRSNNKWTPYLFSLKKRNKIQSHSSKKPAQHLYLSGIKKFDWIGQTKRNKHICRCVPTN